MTDLTDPDLDRRLRAAGAALDELAATRADALRYRPHSRRASRHHPDLGRAPRLLVAAAVVAFAVIAVGAAVVLRSDPNPDGPPERATAPETTRRPGDDDPEDEPVPEVSPVELPSLGGSGLVVASDGLVDLATGDVTPMLAPADPYGTEAPTAVPDGDGGIFYISFQWADDHDTRTFETGEPEAWPQLRHLSGGRDTLVREGVTSVALRADGALALAVGVDPVRRQNVPFLTTIEVVTPDGTRTTWNEAVEGQDAVAWAGERLLIERHLETSGSSLHVLDGPGRIRDLSPLGSASAIAPDGRWVLVSGAEPGQEPHIPDGPWEPPLLRVVELATGAVIGTVDVGDQVATAGHLTWSGDDRLIGATTTPEGYDHPAVVELAVGEGEDGTVAITEVRTIVLGSRTSGPTEAWAAGEGTIMALADSSGPDYGPRLYVCRSTAPDCSLTIPPFGGQVTYVVNPSRPLRP